MVSTIGTTNTPSFVKIREVTLQNLGDLIWNDPYATSEKFFNHNGTPSYPFRDLIIQAQVGMIAIDEVHFIGTVGNVSVRGLLC